MKVKYNEVISQFYPTLKFSSIGDGLSYEKLILSSGTLPPKSELDNKYLQIARDKAWRRVQIERDRRKATGVKVGTNWFHSDDTSRIQQIALVMMGANMPANLMWKTLGGNFVNMTPTLANQIFMSIAGSDQAIFTCAEQHKAIINSNPDPDSYNHLINPAWPIGFGE